MKKLKAVMVVLDGIGDRPSQELGGKTPLEAARTPNLDALASGGSVGFVSSLQPWVPVGTQTGLGMLMGLARADLRKLTRGPIEAAGAGLDVGEGDVALRCNLATLSRNGKTFDILDRRAGRISDGVADLLSVVDGISLSDGVAAAVAPSTQHRAVVVLRGDGLSAAVTDTDPGAGREAMGVLRSQAMPDNPEAEHTARIVNEFVRRSHDALEQHPLNQTRIESGLVPANGLITRGAGQVFACRNLLSHVGLSAAVVTGEGTAIGLARLFGFTVLTDPAFTASPTTDLTAKIAAVQEALTDHDFVFLHFKGPDVASHDHDPRAKASLMERIDAALEPLLDGETVIGVTGDHSTDSLSGRHTGDPVPSILSGPHMRRDRATAYSEADCVGGGLGHIPATSFLCGCLDLMHAMGNHRAHEYFFFE